MVPQDRDLASTLTKSERLHERGSTAVGEFPRSHKAVRLAWYVVQGTLFRLPLRRADWWRVGLLRMFGARVGRHCLVRRTASIEIPWHLRMGDSVTLGDGVRVYNLGLVVIGSGTMISQGAHLCAGDHDMADSGMPLRRVPISIGTNAWICADAFVGPGVDIGDGAVLGARSAAFRDLPDWTVSIGTPARPHRARPTSHADSGVRRQD